jgi:hypothetical protein
MYSPKIKEEHIPVLYRLAKLKRMPMTRLVNNIIKDYLDSLEPAVRELKAKQITTEIFKRRGEKDGKEIKKMVASPGAG